MKITRHPQNPIVTGGKYDWRAAGSFNPGVALAEDGKFYLYERALESLRPFKCHIGLLSSTDGVNFEHVKDEPVLTSEMVGYPDGTIQDARVSVIDGVYYLVYAVEPYGIDCWPNGIGVPEYYAEHYRDWRKNGLEPRTTQSGIAKSTNGIDFEHVGFTTPREIDDRDNTLFPGKIGNMFALLRRPIQYVGPEYGTDRPGIWISFSEDLQHWSDPELVAVSEQPWEGAKIGGSTMPIDTEQGWLTFYHGVDESSTYRLGVMMLDKEDPRKVIARAPDFIMEPEEYYEKVGLVIPNVIFPTDNVVKDGTIYMYYGCCDTSIGLATVPLDEAIEYVMKYPRD